jgi:cytochrome c biogenesis protein CcdA
LSALTPVQAAQSARQVAEGEEVRLARPSAAWEVVKTIAVVLLGIELLFMLFGLGMSLVVG